MIQAVLDVAVCPPKWTVRSTVPLTTADGGAGSDRAAMLDAADGARMRADESATASPRGTTGTGKASRGMRFNVERARHKFPVRVVLCCSAPPCCRARLALTPRAGLWSLAAHIFVR